MAQCNNIQKTRINAYPFAPKLPQEDIDMVCIGVAVAARILKGVIDEGVLSMAAGASLFFAVFFDGVILAAMFS